MKRLVLALLAAVVAARAFALDPARALTQARLSVWTSESGLPQNTIDAIVQTRDGYLWVGTEEGLARFDGVRFVVFDKEKAPALRSAFVSSLFEGPDGTLWIGTYGGGLSRLRNGRIEAFRPDLLGSERVREMHVVAGGAIFAATAGGGLLRIEGENVTRFTTTSGLPTDRIWAIEADGTGGLWVATHGGGVVRFRGSRVIEQVTTAQGLPSDLARALLREDDGTLWIGTDGGGLVAWRDGRVVRTVTTANGLPNDFVRTLLRDHDGALWIGTDGGLARLTPNGVESLGAAEGLPTPIVRVVFEDRERNLWVGTTGGLVRLRDTRVLSITRKEGLPADTIRAVLENGGGRMWLGTEGGGLCARERGALRCITRRDGLPHDTVYALAASRDGSLWVGTDGGGVVRIRDWKIVETIDRRRGLPNDRVRAVVETAGGDLWISTSAGLALMREGRVTTIPQFSDRQLRPLLALADGSLLVGTDGAGLWKVQGATVTRIASAGRGLGNDRVFSLALDAGGSGVWVGTSGGGLTHLDLRGGNMRTITRREGLHDDVVFQVVDTGRDLWLTSNRGVFRASRDRVRAAMTGTLTDLGGTVYSVVDGMPSAECVGAFPGAVRARDGKIWVATTRGVAVIDPDSGRRNTVPPPVHMEEVLVDGVRAGSRPLRIDPATQRLELRYTAVGLRAPERVRFQYMLEGYDRSWVNAGAERVAHYTRLPPGNYTFRVQAANEDGTRSREDARLTFTVDPRWFETWWARVLALLLIAVAVWGGFRLRLAAVRAKKNEELARAYEDVHRMAAELANANEQLRALSYVDGLTGVANRRRLDDALEEACADASRDGRPVSLVLIDLDQFKHLNDSRGHQVGDEALRSVAALLRERAQPRGELVARFGGEEFAWLMPGVHLADAVAEAEAFRRMVRDAAISHPGTAAGVVTASVGVASSEGANGLSSLSLVGAADAALYRAKSAGRDRVEAAVNDAKPDN